MSKNAKKQTASSKPSSTVKTPEETQPVSPSSDSASSTEDSPTSPAGEEQDGADQTDESTDEGTGDEGTSTVPQNGVITDGTAPDNAIEGDPYKSDQTADKTDEERAQQLGVPQHIASGWQKLPDEGQPEGRILEPGDEFAFDGEEVGNVVIAKENVYRKVTPRGCKRPSYELLVKKGAQMSRTAVQNTQV